jgi:predicted Zn finger-like uncharacterized protein
LVSDPLTEGLYQSGTGPVESSMQIACPNCATSYKIGDASLGESGRMVRCVHCKEIWLAQPPQLADAAAGTPAPSMWQDGQQAGSGWATRETHLPGTSAARPHDRFAASGDEVEFALPSDMQQIDEAPPIVPEPTDDLPAAVPEPEPEPAPADAGSAGELDEPDYYEVRRRRAARKSTKHRAPIVTKPRLIAALAGIMIALVFERENVTRMMPQTASLYARMGLPINLRGLAFDPIKAGLEQQDGVSVLVIEGTIRNVTREPVEVPRLRFAMRNAAGAEIYSWTSLPERAVLPPGEMQAFRTRLASPPADSRHVYVRFFQRRDIVATSQPRTEDGTHSTRGR